VGGLRKLATNELGAAEPQPNRDRTDLFHRFHRLCERKAVFGMRVGLSQPGGKGLAANQRKLRRLRVVVVNVARKGAALSRQMRSTKANASEPSEERSKVIQTMSKPRFNLDFGNSGGGSCNPAAMASGLKAARAWIRPQHGTFEPVAPMPREQPQRGDRKGLSTNAGHRDGTTRSSEEGPVMGLEPRGRVIVSSDTGQPRLAGGGTCD
jgi:hypothetical protein